MRTFLLFLALASALFAAELPRTHRDLAREASAAYARQDFAAARDGFAAALEFRPDSPRYLHNLAATCALTGRTAEALATLRRLAALGVVTRVASDADFASLRETPEFAEILRAFTANRVPRGEAVSFARLPAHAGIIEGIAFRERTRELFLGDVHQRCIWRREADGKLTRFTAASVELLGVFGLAVDETRGALWAATSALPEISGFTPALKGRAALAEFDLTTGQLRRVVPISPDARDHVLGDLLLAPDGAVYATDSAAPILWKLAPRATALENFIESPAFSSLQGLALVHGALVISDYANGLSVIDLSTRVIRPLAPPAHTTLLGIDGLLAVPGGVIAIQNGVSPQRVVRVTLAPDLASISAVVVLAASLPGLDDLALVTLVAGRPTFIAGAGWDVFDPTKSAPPAAHEVRVFQLAAP